MYTADTPVGPLTLYARDGAITAVRFGTGETSARTPVLLQAAQELREYFAGTRREFTVPLAPEGSEFETRVWDALRRIPYGQCASYGEIALTIGSPGAARAVGGACHRNPIAVFIPCHRVTAKNGPGGYAWGMEIKRYLLELEQHAR